MQLQTQLVQPTSISSAIQILPQNYFRESLLNTVMYIRGILCSRSILYSQLFRIDDSIHALLEINAHLGNFTIHVLDSGWYCPHVGVSGSSCSDIYIPLGQCPGLRPLPAQLGRPCTEISSCVRSVYTCLPSISSLYFDSSELFTQIPV